MTRSFQGRRQDGPPPVYRTEVPAHPIDVVAGLPTREGLTVNARSDVDRTGRLVFGTEPGRLTRSLPPTRFPAGEPTVLRLTGLRPGTRHYWQVRCDDGVATPERRFVTALPPGKPFTFAIQADSHLDGGSEPEVYGRALAIARECDFLVDLGDTFMTDKYRPYTASRPQYLAQRYYFDQAQVPVLMAPGNHDGERGADPAMRDWAKNERLRHFPSAPENRWAYTCGDTLLIALDPYGPTTDRPRRRDDAATDNWYVTLGRTQYDGLAQTLAESRAAWKFVFIHNLVGGLGRDNRGGAEAAPFWEWGGKDADGTDRFAQKRPGWPLPIHALLVKHQVAAVFHGHDHLYARQEIDGIVYQCVPQPGHGRGGASRSAESYGYKSGTILDGAGLLTVDVGPDAATVTFRRTDSGPATVAHRYTLNKSGRSGDTEST